MYPTKWRVHHKKNKPEEIISEKTIDTGREITKVIKTLDAHPELEESDYDYDGFPIELNAYITFFDQQGNRLQVSPPEIDDLKDYNEELLNASNPFKVWTEQVAKQYPKIKKLKEWIVISSNV